MKKPKLLLVFAVLAAALVFACKKGQFQTATSLAESQRAQTAITELSKRYSQSPVSGTLFNETASQLDYNDVVEIKRTGRAALTLIHLSVDDVDGRKRYLAVAEPRNGGDNAYHVEGVFSASNRTQIEHAIQTNRVDKGNLVTLHGLDKKPTTEWDGTGPKPVVRIAMPKGALTAVQLAMIKPNDHATIKTQGITPATNASQPRLDYMAQPEETCLD